MSIDFNKLRTFITVAKLQSVTRAAASLHLSQQAVSHQIATLEYELGVTLFVRANRKIFLSAEGRRVLSLAESNLLPLEDELIHLKQQSTELKGSIIIGCLTEIGRQFVLPLISRFNQDHPEVKFELRFEGDKTTENRVMEGEVDIGIVIFKSLENHLVSRSFATVPYVAVASPKLIACQGSISRINQLADYPFVDFQTTAPSFRAWINKNSKSLLDKILYKQPEVVVPDERGLKQLILAGVGLGVIPEYLVRKEIEQGSLVEILPRSKKVSSQLELLYLKKRQLPKRVAAFIDLALAEKNLF